MHEWSALPDTKTDAYDQQKAWRGGRLFDKTAIMLRTLLVLCVLAVLCQYASSFDHGVSRKTANKAQTADATPATESKPKTTALYRVVVCMCVGGVWRMHAVSMCVCLPGAFVCCLCSPVFARAEQQGNNAASHSNTASATFIATSGDKGKSLQSRVAGSVGSVTLEHSLDGVHFSPYGTVASERRSRALVGTFEASPDSDITLTDIEVSELYAFFGFGFCDAASNWLVGATGQLNWLVEPSGRSTDW